MTKEKKMKKTVLGIILIWALGVHAAELDLRNKRVMIVGDSITQHHTWVSLIDYYLQKTFPEDTIDLIGVGLSSETASGLSEEATRSYPRPWIHERLGRLLELVKPEVVIACYGMNDGIYHPQSPDRMAAYQKGMKQLIKTCRSAGVTGFVLMTPPPFDPVSALTKRESFGPDQDDAYSYKFPYKEYDDVLADYGEWLLTLDNGKDILVADVHQALSGYTDQQRTDDPEFSLSQDGVHPQFTGHLLMADTVLGKLGVSVDDSDIAAQEQSIQQDPLFKLVDERSRLLGDSWRKYAGYIRNKEQTMTKVDTIDEQLRQAAELQKQIDAMRKECGPCAAPECSPLSDAQNK
jgi:lysophospholipase L1-like esterase